MIGTLRARIVTSLSTNGIRMMLDTFGSNSAIFAGSRIPEEYQHLNNTILIYPVTPQGPGDIRPVSFLAACRQETELDSIALAELVYEAINRNFHTVTGGSCYMQASLELPAMQEDENCWMTPVRISVRNNL
jgi:hypothetical protein